MYKKLLLSAGGGIVSPNQQAEQAEAATIAIGLGGTGIRCLSKLKNEVYNRIKPDDVDSDIPEYKHIKFFAIDSDSYCIETDNAYLDKVSEFLDIGCSDIDALKLRAKQLKDDPMLDWLNPNMSIINAGSGAGGNRQIGRLLFMQNSNQFVEKLTAIIRSAVTNLSAAAPVSVHIFTGMGGGTGSGIFLDVCYLVRYVLEQMNLAGRVAICGYFFLPDVNLNSVYAAEVRDYIKINGFASMKELDYCMNFSKNGGEWKQQYNGFEYKTNKQPVDLAFLVSATDVNNSITISDYPFSTVVNYVLEYMVNSYIPEFSIAYDYANMRWHTSVLPQNYDVCYDYCVLGASDFYIPHKEINTYLASKTFESFGRLNENAPDENDLDVFIRSNGLTYEDILKELNSQVPTVPVFDVDMRTLYEQCQGISPDMIPQMLSPMRRSGQSNLAMLMRKKEEITSPTVKMLFDDGKEENPLALISRVKKSLVQIASDPDKGPYYSAALLHSNSTKDLRNVIDGYIKINEEALAYAREDLGLKEQAVANTLREFQNSNRFNRRSKGEAYVSVVHEYFLAVTKTDGIIALAELLKVFKMQLEELYEQFFKRLIYTLDNLSETFSANLSFLSNPNCDNKKPYPIITVSELKPYLDSYVSEMKIPDIVNHFIDALINDEENWISQDENKISASVTKFFLSELNNLTNRTIMYYLQLKYNTAVSEELTDNIFNDIIKPAYDLASPLLWTDASKYSISDAGKIEYCFVPEISPEINSAADELCRQYGTINKRVVECYDRISVFKLLCGVPMLAYKGVSEYYDIYKNRKFEGVHIYEGYGEDGRDYRNIPNIIPSELID